LLPTVTVPKLRLVELTAKDPTDAPVPDSGIARLGFDAFEVRTMLPLAAPEEVGVKLALKLALWPAFKLNGRLIPFTLNPLPLAVAAEIVTAVPPLFVTVSDKLWLLPTVTVPKLRLAALAVKEPTDAPVPESGIVEVGFEAFEVTVKLPLAAPEAVGAKVTLKLALWPALKVIGIEIPLTLNPLPLVATEEIVTLVPPVLVSVSGKVFALPILTLPKFRLPLLRPSAPGKVPVPESPTANGGFEAFEAIVTLPLTVPATVGLNDTLKLALCPAVKVTGAVMPLTLNPVPLAVTPEIVTLLPPVLVTVSDNASPVPTAKLPKLRLPALTPRVPGETPVPARGMVKVGVAAFDVVVRLPLADPDDAGTNVTFTVVL
jgi:hypothetical protein